MQAFKPLLLHRDKKVPVLVLEGFLPEGSTAFITYLRSLREVHSLCVATELDPNYKHILDEFEVNFRHLYEEEGLNMPLKVHVIVHLNNIFL